MNPKTKYHYVFSLKIASKLLTIASYSVYRHREITWLPTDLKTVVILLVVHSPAGHSSSVKSPSSFRCIGSYTQSLSSWMKLSYYSCFDNRKIFIIWQNLFILLQGKRIQKQRLVLYNFPQQHQNNTLMFNMLFLYP